MIPAASPFALTQSFSTEAFRPGMPANRDAIAAEPQMSLGRLSCDLGSIAATNDAIDDAISRGLMVNVLGTKVVAFGSRLALLNFVGERQMEQPTSARPPRGWKCRVLVSVAGRMNVVVQ